ncbi:MAG: hypothetical protein A4S09_17370 [Proteobacteria bacterium SG_bin7]|nr:MAG: hypothetical protein A4S09_17370 [Proteobacteria bacterium SG_bin7]
MNETKPILDEQTTRLLSLPRGSERHFNHFQIVIAILHLAGPLSPTRDQLQILSRIRRKRFIAVLKYLVDTGAVIKFGDGTKHKGPFKYRLPTDTEKPRF